jgi:hypothetical protein
MQTFIRPDEKQYVFVMQEGEEFKIVETAELWELPYLAGSQVFFYYPTVLGTETFPTLNQARSEVARRYAWASDLINPG